jgi:outer membrane autotransporter protein
MIFVSPTRKRASLVLSAAFPAACLMAALLILAPLTALAEDITWDGSGTLQTDPWGIPAVFPDVSSPSGNNVTISGDVAGDVEGGVSYSAGSDNTATNDNTVNLQSGAVTGDVYGGSAESNTGSATATGNSVHISGGAVDDYVYGGRAASNSGSATATGNTVNISGGTVGYDVYGGLAQSNTGSATATGNSVNISGGTVGGDVVGGVAYSNSGSATATGNTVTLSGAPTFSGSSPELLGGNGSGPGGSVDTFTGNTLNVWNYSGTNTFNTIANFEYFNFVLPNTVQDGFTYLTATFTLYLGNGTGTNSQVSVGIVGGKNPALQDGDRVTLLAGTSTTTGTIPNATIDGKQGALLDYRFTVGMDGNNVVATVNGNPTVNPQAKALSEGFLSGVALINQGADLAADKGIGMAVRNAQTPGLQAFGAFGGGWSRYNTGSHVDVSGFSLLTGLSYGLDTAPGRLTLGAFFEYGQGDYDSHNSFSNAASVKGGGDTDYLGGGILGRFDFSDTGPGHFYTEITGRVGRVESDFSSSDLRDSMGRRAEYDTESLYYGLHLGAGYVWKITEAASLDLYGKYFWTRQEGDSVTLSTGDHVRFDDVDSHRLRFGGRFAYAVNEYVSPYIGAAWEHEFDGKAKATTYGYSIDAPDLTGDTGMGELGLTVRPAAGGPFSFDLGVQGYTGKREGVTGSLQVKLEF